MKKLNTILSITIVIVLIAGSTVVAQGPEEAGRGVGSQFSGRRGDGMMGGGPGHMMGRGGRMGGIMGRGTKGRRGGMGMIFHLADELDLSESQREELSEIFTSHRKEVIRQKAEIELEKVDLHKLMRQEEPNLDEVESQIRNIANMQATIKFSQFEVRVNVRNVLTEEQKTALKKIRQDRQAKRKADAKYSPQRRQMRRGPRPRE